VLLTSPKLKIVTFPLVIGSWTSITFFLRLAAGRLGLGVTPENKHWSKNLYF